MVQVSLFKQPTDGEFWAVVNAENGEQLSRTSQAYVNKSDCLRAVFLTGKALGGYWDGRYKDYSTPNPKRSCDYITRTYKPKE